jgi:hypothetical protein
MSPSNVMDTASSSITVVRIHQATQSQIEKIAVFIVIITKHSNFTLGYVLSSEKQKICFISIQDAESVEITNNMYFL